MKNSLKAIRLALATLLIVVASQANLLAANGDNATDSGLSAGQVVGGFVLLLLVVLMPLVKSSNRAIVRK